MGDKDLREGFSRRDFLKTGLAGAAVVSLSGMPLEAQAQQAKKAAPAGPPAPPELKPEKGAVLRVLRWTEYVKSEREFWEKNNRKWEERTGGKVLTEYISLEDIRPKAAMAASVGAGHDIVFGWHDDPHLYPDKLVDVTDLATYLGRKYGGWEFVCPKYAMVPKTGRWIGLPLGSIGIALPYRESWVKEAGYEKPPKDIYEYIKMCKKLKAIGHPPGFALGHGVGDSNCWTHHWLWAFGGKCVDKDGNIVINSPPTWTSLETAKELYETFIPGTGSWLDPHNNKAFLAGEISLTNNAISIYFAAKDKFPEVAKDMNHVNNPIGPVGRPTELHIFIQPFIFKYTRFPNAAKHYLLFMLEEEQMNPWIEGSLGYITPGLKAYKKHPVWTSDPKVTPYRDCTANMLWAGYEGPVGPSSAAVLAESIVVDLFCDVCLLGKSPKAAAAAAQDRLARYYKARGKKG